MEVHVAGASINIFGNGCFEYGLGKQRITRGVCLMEHFVTCLRALHPLEDPLPAMPAIRGVKSHANDWLLICGGGQNEKTKISLDLAI
ncbi:hypothetical protein Tco_0630686 [Tanacetum coccineum]